MLKKKFNKMIKRFGAWRLVQVGLVVCSVILLCTAGVLFFARLPEDGLDRQAGISVDVPVSYDLPTKEKKNKELGEVYRAGLFKGSGGLSRKPLADKTIERIKSQLTLKCVMEMNGQLVAYINIKGMGLKKCRVGDSISDLFGVLDINKQNKSVDVLIVEHKVTLQL